MYKSSSSEKETPSQSKGGKGSKGTKGQETKERIFQLALEYFNLHGIEYVGIRELARELGLSPGNVSYYFPTKEDMIMELTRRLSAENSQIFAEVESNPSLHSFLDLFEKAFHNHYKYRCLFVSFVHTIKHHAQISERYLSIQEQRRRSLKNDLILLVENGYLKKTMTSSDMDWIVHTTSHIARFWIQEAEVLYSAIPIEKVKDHNIGLIAGTLQPFATKKGEHAIEPFISKIFTIS